MNIGRILKRVELGVLNQAGIHVTPEQVGLKQEGANRGSFRNLLGGSALLQGAGVLPEPPKPPQDPTDVEAMRLYNEELLAYNQKTQVYNQRLFRVMFQQFQLAQRQALQARTQTSTSQSASTSSGLGGETTLSTGGIL